MARGDKNYDKKVRTVNKGQSAEKKKKAIHSMVESLIKGDSKAAEDNLHDYLQMKSREIVLGEMEDDREEEMVADEKDKDFEDEDDDEDEDFEDEDKEDFEDKEDMGDEDMGDEDEVV